MYVNAIETTAIIAALVSLALSIFLDFLKSPRSILGFIKFLGKAASGCLTRGRGVAFYVLLSVISVLFKAGDVSTAWIFPDIFNYGLDSSFIF